LPKGETVAARREGDPHVVTIGSQVSNGPESARFGAGLLTPPQGRPKVSWPPRMTYLRADNPQIAPCAARTYDEPPQTWARDPIGAEPRRGDRTSCLLIFGWTPRRFSGPGLAGSCPDSA